MPTKKEKKKREWTENIFIVREISYKWETVGAIDENSSYLAERYGPLVKVAEARYGEQKGSQRKPKSTIMGFWYLLPNLIFQTKTKVWKEERKDCSDPRAGQSEMAERNENCPFWRKTKNIRWWQWRWRWR